MTKTRLTVYIDKDIKDQLDKRAKKELLSTEELAIDILRRSIVSYKGKSSTNDNVDDKFLTFFSRKNNSKKRKKKAKKK